MNGQWTEDPPPEQAPVTDVNGSAASSDTPTAHPRPIVDGEEIPRFPVRGCSREDLARAREIVEKLKEKYGFLEPDRGDLSDPSIDWREGKPDYTVADLEYMAGKTKNHKAGSLELIVENMVKTWEMEATHKRFEQWTTVNHSKYTVQANGGKVFNSEEAAWIGNYNWLLSTCDKGLYDSEHETFESSHGRFRFAFPHGFPWEVLEVYSGPPTVFFSWRHWAEFVGEYEGHHGDGDTLELTGFCYAKLENMKINSLEIFYNPDLFIEVLKGKKDGKILRENGAAVGNPIVGCPFHHAKTD